ncbi:MAG: oxidoreductase [Thermoguttaceae bacterium]
MSRHERFHLSTADALRAELDALGLQLPIEEDVAVLGRPLRIGHWVTPNRLVIQPMEGFDATADGSPGPLSFRRYRRYGAGGSGLIWFEATAVLQEARSNPHQLLLHAGNVGAFARLVEVTRRAAREALGQEIVALIQLTHSGRYSKPAGTPCPMIAHHSPVLDPKHDLPPDYPLVSDEYLDRLQDVYLEAARLARSAGFDGVDIKACHRYLVSELLASHTRPGKYGGPLENRSRFLREVIQKVRDALPDSLVATRINVYDAIPFPYGFGVDPEDYRVPDLREPLELIGQLRQLGVALVNVTAGNPYYNPHYGRPFDWPALGVDIPDEHPLEGVWRLIHLARQVQQALPDLPVVGTGYSWLRHLMPYVAAGVIRAGWASLIGQGRSAFAYPEAARDILTEGRMRPEKSCMSCSGCSQIMRDGAMTGCVVRDREIYAEQYQLGRRLALDRLRQEAMRCRDCQFAPCTAGCPSGVDVPAFVRAFAQGDMRRAYDVLRRSNVLPELCAQVCPAEVQCEAGCLEQVFSDRAVPIRDIQLAVSRLARQAGWAGVRLPPEPTGRRVAVVGAGPAGLACAIRLLEKGHCVVLFEKNDHLGGIPEASIPASRCAAACEEIDAILAPAKAANRIEIRFGQRLGRQMSLAELRSRFDAVFLAMGLPGSTPLGSTGALPADPATQAEDAGSRPAGVSDAVSFLRDAKQGTIPALAGRVAVLGGGNTAIDAALTARKLGAEDVYLIYRRSLAEMPAWPECRRELFESGCHPMILTQPLGYQTDQHGRLTGLCIARTELGPPDASGRRTPRVLPGTESVLRVDLVIEALGQAIPGELHAALRGLGLTPDGLVATRPGSQATSLPGVFAGGDLVNGGRTAVQAVAEGLRAAEEIDQAFRTGMVSG